jgi:hypothetical protein
LADVNARRWRCQSDSNLVQPLVPLDGYLTGFTINAVILIASGLLGLLLLWPNTERARLMAQAAQAKFA